MEDLRDFHINSFTSSFYTFSIHSTFFSIFQFIRYTSPFRATILRQTYKRKKQFLRKQGDKFLNGKEKTKHLKLVSADIWSLFSDHYQSMKKGICFNYSIN